MLRATRTVLTTLLCIGVVIFLLVLFTVFSQHNATLIPLYWFDQILGRLSLPNWLVLAFLAGGVLGLLSAFLTLVKLKMNHAALLRKLRRREKEVQRLRAQALQGMVE